MIDEMVHFFDQLTSASRPDVDAEVIDWMMSWT